MPAWKLRFFKVLPGVLGLACLLVMSVNFYYKERVPYGVYMADVYLGGRSFQEVEALLDREDRRLKKEKIHIYFAAGNQPLVFSLEELGLALSKKKMLQEIKGLKFSFNAREMYRFMTHNVSVPGHFNFDQEKFKVALRPLQAEQEIPPQNAAIRAVGGRLQLQPAHKGRHLKTEKTGKEMLERLSHWPAFPLVVNLETEWLFPERTALDVLKLGIQEEMATASTYFNSRDQNRVHNITLAAEKLDNTLLAPGELFSFNQLVGEANREAGYKEAPVIVQGRVVPGPGGGICQVSSTLYHAALLAGLGIEERHNHGLPVGYLPPGYDATIAYDYLDLKLRNNKPHHILVHLQILENSIRAVIFGSPSPAEKIEIVTQGLQKIDPPVTYRQNKGMLSTYHKIVQKGKPGFIAETVRIFYRDGQEIEREYLGRDHYAPVPQIIEVGTLPEEARKQEVDEIFAGGVAEKQAVTAR